MILYTTLAHRAIADMTRVVPALRHIDPRRLAVVAAGRVSVGRYGNLAQCHALREPEREDFSFWYHPSTRRIVRATPWFRRVNTRVALDGHEALYLILLRLPRLLEHDPIETIVHELIHIGLDFDGRMHRLRHGKRFDARVAACVEQWRREGDPELIEAMGLPYEALVERWGSLVGAAFGSRFVTQRLCPVTDPPPMGSHPQIRKKRLFFDPAKVEMVEPKWTAHSVPASLSERNLEYRVYAPRSARRISAAAVRNAPGLFPPEAFVDISARIKDSEPRMNTNGHA